MTSPRAPDTRPCPVARGPAPSHHTNRPPGTVPDRRDEPMTSVRLLTFSTLFPHAARPNQGIFVENRLRHLVDSGEATSLVLAPVPWFPSRAPMFGDWAVH